MSICPCGLQNYSDCCALYHSGKQSPLTPEALMRSRYSAYALGKIDYIKNTMQGKAALDFDEANAKSWAQSVQWLGLKIINTRNTSADLGFVEFIARFMEAGTPQSIHEKSEFHRIDGKWYYVDGTRPNNPKNALSVKLGRNSLCPCGSHKKFKNCHGKPVV